MRLIRWIRFRWLIHKHGMGWWDAYWIVYNTPEYEAMVERRRAGGAS